MSAPLVFDVCVVGGGPAGSTIARRLAALGHRVCIIERSAFPRPHVGESLPPSILPVLDHLGVRDRIEAAGFLRPDRTLVRWGSQARDATFTGTERGLQVDRDRFDALLLDAARDKGAHVLQPAATGRIDRAAGRWRIALRGGGTIVHARVLVDAAGRSGVLPRQRVRVAPSTAALYAYWADASVTGTETRVEAGEAAWYWGAPLPCGAWNATVFVDAARCQGLCAERRGELYRHLLAQSSLLGGCLRGRPFAPVRICDATPFVDAQPVTATTIKVGEAAFAIDPLSSQGVQTSITSAIQASAVVHTSVHLPEHAALAQTFYRDRVLDAAKRHDALAADAYRDGANTAHAFWTERAAGSARAADRPVVPHDPHTVRLSASARIEPSAVLDGDFIREATALRHPNLGRDVAFLGGVALAPLVEAVTGPAERDELILRWTRHAPTALCRQIFDWLWQRGVLEEARAVGAHEGRYRRDPSTSRAS